VLCKGGVVMPVTETGLGQAASVPDGFPGRVAAAARMGEELFLAWAPVGGLGLHWSVPARRNPQSGSLARDQVVANLDCVSMGEEVLLVWTQEGEEPGESARLYGAVLPGGRPFPILPDTLEEPDELRIIAGGPSPVLSVVTGVGSACLVAVRPEGSRLIAMLSRGAKSG
jgi:hypothetical protein